MKVYVYFNLHKRCWSVKALEGAQKGRVIAHEDFVILRDVVGKVSEAGRQRVLRERKKNVHAGMVGEWVPEIDESNATNGDAWLVPEMVTYNPYKYDSFVYTRTGERFDGAPYLLMNADADNKLMAFQWEDM